MRTPIFLAVMAVTAAAAGIAHAGPTGRVVGKVTVTEADGKPAAGADVIVYVVGFTEPPANQPETIKQQGRRFVPDLVAITAGDKIVFPNEDPFLHNVFSQSRTRKFDLGSYKKGESKDKQFPDAGVVDVYCNIHPEMAATILILPNRRFMRVKPDGNYVLEGVPAGTWTVFAYTRRVTKPVTAKVTVTPNVDSVINLTIVRSAETEHLNKYGGKYTGPDGTYR
jgi:plastocyanin